jgi:TRAP-type C4-dicarboxylate transport system substrate-binding protein
MKFASEWRSTVVLPWVLISFIIIALAAALQPPPAMAADTAQAEFKSILHDSLEALWTGQEFSPALIKRQEKMKAMLNSGAVDKGQLEDMIKTILPPFFDRHQTNRYILKNIPERANALFTPVISWDELKLIIWRTITLPVDKDDPLFIKVGTLAPPGTPWLSVPETITFPEIERLSDKRVQIKIFGGGVMGEDTDILRKMDIGQLDCCGCTAIGVLAGSPDTSALLMPGLFNNYEEVDYICEKFRQRLDQGFESKGYILAALIDTGYFYIFSKNKISSLADVKKQKILTWFGNVETGLYQELGINATPVAVPEVVSALSTGLADTNLAPAAWMLGMQAYQYANYYLKPPLLYSPAAIIVSLRTKDRLQKQAGISATYAFNVQEMIIYEFNAVEPEWKRQIREYEQKSLRAFESKCGIKPITLSSEDQQRIKEASKAMEQKLAGKVFPGDLLDDMQKALEEYRARPKTP